MTSSSVARVRATYNRRASSARSAPVVADRIGTSPVSTPVTNTVCHSRPLAPWNVRSSTPRSSRRSNGSVVETHDRYATPSPSGCSRRKSSTDSATRNCSDVSTTRSTCRDRARRGGRAPTTAAAPRIPAVTPRRPHHGTASRHRRSAAGPGTPVFSIDVRMRDELGVRAREHARHRPCPTRPGSRWPMSRATVAASCSSSVQSTTRTA